MGSVLPFLIIPSTVFFSTARPTNLDMDLAISAILHRKTVQTTPSRMIGKTVNTRFRRPAVGVRVRSRRTTCARYRNRTSHDVGIRGTWYTRYRTRVCSHAETNVSRAARRAAVIDRICTGRPEREEPPTRIRITRI